MQQQPQFPDISTLEFRVKSIEQNVQQLQVELRTYVPASINDLQLQSIRSTVERIENDVRDAKKQVTDLNTQLSSQAKEQDQIQIRVLKYFAVTVIGLLIALLVAHLAHFV